MAEEVGTSDVDPEGKSPAKWKGTDKWIFDGHQIMNAEKMILSWDNEGRWSLTYDVQIFRPTVSATYRLEAFSKTGVLLFTLEAPVMKGTAGGPTPVEQTGISADIRRDWSWIFRWRRSGSRPEYT